MWLYLYSSDDSCHVFTHVFPEVAPLKLGQSYGCPCVNEVTLHDVGKIDCYLNTTKHKTWCAYFLRRIAHVLQNLLHSMYLRQDHKRVWGQSEFKLGVYFFTILLLLRAKSYRNVVIELKAYYRVHLTILGFNPSDAEAWIRWQKQIYKVLALLLTRFNWG